MMSIRPAIPDDIPHLVSLYADDDPGRTRDGAAEIHDTHRSAFAAIASDPNHVLAVGEVGGRIVATLLVSFLPGLSRGGNWRAQIEAMRVARDLRGQGFGRQMLDWAVAQARARGCRLVQLTSDRTRADAHRFYQSAGFVPSHVGFKMVI